MEHMLTILIIINIIINIAIFAIFELKKPAVRDFLPLVVICAGASLGRVIFSFMPQIQPVTVLVIITGSAYGSLYGYVTGSLCALISNMMLGQGPWTFFQMTGWGIIGFIAGILGHLFKRMPEKNNILISADDFCKPHSCTVKEKGYGELAVFSLYGFLSAFLFSIVTDTLSVAYLGEAVTLSSAVAVFATGMVFNAGHGIFNVVLIILLYKPVKKSFLRCKCT